MIEAYPKLLTVDYDGTVSLTSETAPGIKTVNDAYADALDTHFGAEAAQQFINDSGHNHRTPAEIVQALYPDMTSETVEEYAAKIVAAKLDILVEQIGTSLPDGAIWPRFSAGFAENWSYIHEHRNDNQSVDTAILSAGHTSFIRKTFELQGLPPADILITDDVLSELGLALLPPEERAKPATLVLDLAEFIWRNRRQLPLNGIELQHKADHVLHVGDDAHKDGQLATNGHIGFKLISAETASAVWHEVRLWTGLGELAGKGATSG